MNPHPDKEAHGGGAMSELEELKKLAEAATDGPWHYQERSDAYTHIVRAFETRFLCQLSQGGKDSEPNARFIAAANPQTVLNLISRLQKAEARAEKAEGALKPFAMLSKAMLENELPAKILEDNFTPVLSCGSVYRDDWAVEVYVADLRNAAGTLPKVIPDQQAFNDTLDAASESAPDFDIKPYRGGE